MFTRFKLTTFGSVLSTLLACWTSTASAQNLILNPGFELNDGTTADDWSTFAGSPQAVSLDSTLPHSGNFALKMCCGTVDPGGGFAGGFQKVLNIIPGTQYTFSAWAKAENNNYLTDGPDTNGREDVGVKFEWHTDPGGANSEITAARVEFGFISGATGPGILQNPILSDTYQQYSFQATAPEGAFHFRPVFAARHITEAVYFDDISLTQLLPPDTPNFALTVDRSTGNITLENNGTGTGEIKEVRITSATGALDPIRWTSIAGNYDLAGNGSVDVDDNWTRQTLANTELRETGNNPSDGGSISVGQMVDLGNNAWIQSLTEDIVAEVTYADGSPFKPGETRSAAVTFTGGPNGGNSFERSDLNFDGDIDSADWPLLRDNLFTSITTTSSALAYQAGDINGDFKADFGDLNVFKADFDAAQGQGAFAAMVASVPEPSTLAMVAFGLLGLSLSRKRQASGLSKAACLLAVALTAGLIVPSAAPAADVDFTTFTVDNYPLIDGTRFNFPTYNGTTPLTASTAVLDTSSNPHVFYGTQSILNKRITGTINAGADNDFVGLALGYTAGYASTLDPSTNPTGADFLLLDWKFNDSTQNMADDIVDHSFFFHDLTLGREALAGLALSRVTGSPTGDELWGHFDTTPANSGFDNNPFGGVNELQRGAASGSTGYVTNQDHVFDISYTSSKIVVKIDGTEEINVSGTFPDGVLGLYSMDQNPLSGAPTYSNFKISAFDEGLLTATINTLSGSVTLTNQTSDPISLNGYTLESPSGSLNFGAWNSLQDQNRTGFEAGDGTGNGWEEGAGSSDSVLVEANLTTISTLGAGASVSLGAVFDTSGTQDLVFSYSEGNGLVSTGLNNYVNTTEVADLNNDGFVDGLDLGILLGNFDSVATPEMGELNGLDPVDGLDLGILLGAWNPPQLSAETAVPEPTSVLLLILATSGLTMIRSR